MKRLYKVRNGKLCGVCGGLAAYFELDPTLVRLGWVIFSCMAGAGLVAYIIAAVIMPYEDQI